MSDDAVCDFHTLIHSGLRVLSVTMERAQAARDSAAGGKAAAKQPRAPARTANATTAKGKPASTAAKKTSTATCNDEDSEDDDHALYISWVQQGEAADDDDDDDDDDDYFDESEEEDEEDEEDEDLDEVAWTRLMEEEVGLAVDNQRLWAAAAEDFDEPVRTTLLRLLEEDVALTVDNQRAAAAEEFDEPILTELCSADYDCIQLPLESTENWEASEDGGFIRETEELRYAREAVDVHGWSPLHILCFQRHCDARILRHLAQFDDVHMANALGNTCLHMACYSGNLEAAMILVQEYGCDVNQHGEHLDTPLHAAVFQDEGVQSREQDLQLVDFLLSANADLNELDDDGCTPVMAAIDEALKVFPLMDRGHAARIADRLVRSDGYDISLTDREGQSLLHRCMLSNALPDPELHLGNDFCYANIWVPRLLERGADIHQRNKEGLTPFELLLSTQYVEIRRNRFGDDSFSCCLRGANDFSPLRFDLDRIDNRKQSANQEMPWLATLCRSHRSPSQAELRDLLASTSDFSALYVLTPTLFYHPQHLLQAVENFVTSPWGSDTLIEYPYYEDTVIESGKALLAVQQGCVHQANSFTACSMQESEMPARHRVPKARITRWRKKWAAPPPVYQAPVGQLDAHSNFVRMKHEIIDTGRNSPALQETAPVPAAEHEARITRASSARPKRKQAAIRVKHEDADEGVIRCPECGGGVLANGGCNLTVCRAPHVSRGGGWYYFCCFCKDSLLDGIECSKPTCPSRNNRETRQIAKQRRNEEARLNPIELD